MTDFLFLRLGPASPSRNDTLAATGNGLMASGVIMPPDVVAVAEDKDCSAAIPAAVVWNCSVVAVVPEV